MVSPFEAMGYVKYDVAFFWGSSYIYSSVIIGLNSVTGSASSLKVIPNLANSSSTKLFPILFVCVTLHHLGQPRGSVTLARISFSCDKAALILFSTVLSKIKLMHLNHRLFM